MNYESFSPEAQRAISKFREFVNEIILGKIDCKIQWTTYSFVSDITRIEMVLNGSFTIGKYNEYSYLSGVLLGICGSSLNKNEYSEVLRFIENKNCFLPKIISSSEEDFTLQVLKYPFFEKPK